MSRYQSGHIYEASGAFFVRYYVSEIVDGKATRVQRSHRLCDKDDKYHSRTCKAVKQKCRRAHGHGECERCSGQRPDHRRPSGRRLTCPSRKKISEHSTVHGYKQIWGQHLSTHFGTTALKDYKTHMGSLFLTSPREETRQAYDSARPVSCVRHLHPCESTSVSSSPTRGTMSRFSARRRNPARQSTIRLKRLRTSSPLLSSMSIVS